MKIRKGFVTNSSSSSFILGFANEDEINTILDTEISSYYESYKEELKREIKNCKNEYSLEDILCMVEYYYEYLDIGFKEKIEKLNKIEEKLKKNNILCVVEHGDGGNGEDGILEHEILPRLSCVIKQISNH